jgi:hypothetical protein
LINEPAFRLGEFYALNSANIQNTQFGRLPGETSSGHWLYAFLRFDASSDQRFLIVVNLHRQETLRAVGVWLPKAALDFLQVENGSAWQLADRLAEPPTASLDVAAADGNGILVHIPECTPLTACYFQWLRATPRPPNP